MSPIRGQIWRFHLEGKENGRDSDCVAGGQAFELSVEFSLWFRLEQVRSLLRGAEDSQRRERPAVSRKATSFNAAKFAERPKKRRTMSAAGRARIVAAQKKRWARQHREEKKAAVAPAQEDSGQ
jgi:hypothetical protein